MNTEDPTIEDLLLINRLHRYWLHAKGTFFLTATVFTLWLTMGTFWMIPLAFLGSLACWSALHDLEVNRELREELLNQNTAG